MNPPLSSLTCKRVSALTPCIHGGEVWKFKDNSILDFSANINPLGPPRQAIESIIEAAGSIRNYPDPESTVLRRMIADYLGVKTGNVIVGNGSIELIHLFAEVFIGSGDAALIPVPTFGEYEAAVKRFGGKPKYVRLTSGFHLKPESIIKRMKNVKVLFICNPNNPTGILAEKHAILELVERAMREDILVFVDEGFIEFVDGEKDFTLTCEVDDYWNLFVLRSFTKSFGLAGLRVGYGVANEEMIRLLFKVKVPWNVNCLAQRAAMESLRDKAYLERTRTLIGKERSFLINELNKIKGVEPIISDVNFLLINICRSGLTAPKLKEKMLRCGVLIRDCSSFRGLNEYYVRVAVRTRMENEHLLASLRRSIG